MSQDADPSIEESSLPVRRDGPGSILRAAREAAGLDCAHVARSLNLEKNVVEALESDDVEHLPEPAYVKGYLRAYARLLDLDVGTLLQAYAGMEVPQPEVLPRESASSGADQRVRVQVVGGLVVLILIVLSAWWLTRPKPSSAPAPQAQVTRQQTQQMNPANAVAAPSTAQQSGQAVEPVISGGAAVQQAPAATSPTATSASTTAPAASVTPKTTVADSATPAAAAAAPAVSSAASTAAAPANGSEAQLVLQLTAKSWVQIDDGAGKQLFRGLLDAGTRRTFSGTPPFAVFLGYAPGVMLQVDGKQVSAAQYTLNNNTARFTLLADGRTRR
jgi:cytoskeleton protein RodZ